MSDHEHDESCGGQPNWRFSLWDVAGITMFGIAGIFSALHQTGNLIARELEAMANYSRQSYDLRQARKQHEAHQAQMAAELRGLVEGDGS